MKKVYKYAVFLMLVLNIYGMIEGYKRFKEIDLIDIIVNVILIVILVIEVIQSHKKK